MVAPKAGREKKTEQARPDAAPIPLPHLTLPMSAHLEHTDHILSHAHAHATCTYMCMHMCMHMHMHMHMHMSHVGLHNNI